MLNAFLVADQADAEKIGNSLNPSFEFAGLEAPEIDSVKLGALNAIVADANVIEKFLSEVGGMARRVVAECKSLLLWSSL